MKRAPIPTPPDTFAPLEVTRWVDSRGQLWDNADDARLANMELTREGAIIQYLTKHATWDDGDWPTHQDLAEFIIHHWANLRDRMGDVTHIPLVDESEEEGR